MKFQREESAEVKAETGKVINPKMTVNHEIKRNCFCIEIDLAGANKETVELQLGTYGLSVKADGESIQYYGSCPLGYNIIPEKAKANYDNGVLYISLPVKQKTLKGTKIEITA